MPAGHTALETTNPLPDATAPLPDVIAHLEHVNIVQCPAHLALNEEQRMTVGMNGKHEGECGAIFFPPLSCSVYRKRFIGGIVLNFMPPR